MDENAWEEGCVVVLRADVPVPSLHLRGEWTLEYYPEWAGSLETLWLHAQLQGQVSSFTIATHVYREDLAQLVDCLQALSSLQNDGFSWSDSENRIRLTVAHDQANFGDNITCDVSLRSSQDGDRVPWEEYRCKFATTLPWVDDFLTGMRRMLLHPS